MRKTITFIALVAIGTIGVLTLLSNCGPSNEELDARQAEEDKNKVDINSTLWVHIDHNKCPESRVFVIDTYVYNNRDTFAVVGGETTVVVKLSK